MSTPQERIAEVIKRHVEEAVAESMAVLQEAASMAFGLAPTQPQASAVKKSAPTAKKNAKGASKVAAKPGIKRAVEEIDKIKGELAAYIAANPGQGIEAIGKGLSRSTSEITLPMKKLFGEGRVQVRGTRRASKYFPKATA